MTVDANSFLAIVLAAAVAAAIVGIGGTRVIVPVVVLELGLGILIGPEVLGLAESDDFVNFFSSLGLGMLFFFAGYEIDFDRIKGAPLKLGIVGWIISLGLAYAIGGALAAAGIVLSLLFTGTAIATTAIGTLIPILGDAGEMKTRFGTYLLAAGAVGEFGPILLITLFFSAGNPLSSGLLLIAFVVIAVVAAVLAVRGVSFGWSAFERTMETSSQLPVRMAVVLVFVLAALATDLGLDLLLGGLRRRDHHPHRARRARGADPRVEAERRRLRLPDPVLLRRQRDRVRPRCPHQRSLPSSTSCRCSSPRS